MIVETSILAFEKIKGSLEPLEQEVWLALLELGPTHDLRLQEYLQQREKQKPRRDRRQWKINVVTARRGGLCNKGQVRLFGLYKGQWNDEKKVYRIWGLTNDAREPAGWTKLSDEEIKKLQVKAEESRIHRQNRKAAIMRKVFSPSDFGRALVNLRYAKQKERPLETAQMALF